MHLSFDFWKTVGTPNSEYANHRKEFFAKFFSVTPEDASRIYKETSRFMDDYAETISRWFSYDDVLNLLCTNMGSPNANRQEISETLNGLFLQFPPTIDPRLVSVLRKLKGEGHTLSIGSNTQFINGECLAKVMTDIPFDFFVFSDECRFVKPHREFFEEVFLNAKRVNPGVGSAKDVLHVGDNQICDCEGAAAFGMRALKVRDALDTAPVLEAYFETEMVN